MISIKRLLNIFYSAIPLLSLDDIGKEVEDLPINKEKHNDIEILHCNTFTSNIAYLNSSSLKLFL